MKISGMAFAVSLLMFGMYIFSPEAQAENSVLDSLEADEQGSLADDADEDNQSLYAADDDNQSVWSVFFQLALALGAVIFVMFILLKFLGKRTSRFHSTHALQNLGGIALGQQKSVQLIKVGDRLLVVGVGNSIQLLQEIEDEAEVQHLLDLVESNTKEDFTTKAVGLLKGAPMDEAQEGQGRFKTYLEHFKNRKEGRG